MGRVRLGRWSRAHARRSRNPQRAGFGAMPPFGAECVYEETNALLVTSGTTYITHLTLTTPALAAGTYVVGFRAGFMVDTVVTNGDAEVRLLEDGATTVFEENGHGFSSGGAGLFKLTPQSIFAEQFFRTLGMGIHTYELQLRRANNPMNDVGLYWSCIELWSFN